jgi:hypothetical protein
LHTHAHARTSRTKRNHQPARASQNHRAKKRNRNATAANRSKPPKKNKKQKKDLSQFILPLLCWCLHRGLAIGVRTETASLENGEWVAEEKKKGGVRTSSGVSELARAAGAPFSPSRAFAQPRFRNLPPPFPPRTPPLDLKKKKKKKCDARAS